MQPEFIAILVALVTSTVSLVIGLLTIHQRSEESQRSSSVLEAAAVIKGYNGLVIQLQSQVTNNNAEIAQLRIDLARIKAEFEADAARWATERTEMRAQIDSLQIENKQLRARIDELMAIIHGKKTGGVT